MVGIVRPDPINYQCCHPPRLRKGHAKGFDALKGIRTRDPFIVDLRLRGVTVGTLIDPHNRAARQKYLSRLSVILALVIAISRHANALTVPLRSGTLGSEPSSRRAPGQAILTPNRLHGAMTFFIEARCIDREVNRFENATMLFMNPAMTLVLPFESALSPASATGRGFMVIRRNIGEM